MIEFINVSKNFGPVKAVRNLNFEIESGEVVGLLGANGAGKTTTMRLMTGYYQPSRGEVRVDGYSLPRYPRLIKRKIGYLPETPPLYEELSVRNYLDYVATLNEVPSEERVEKIASVVEKLELEKQIDRLIGNLSRGYSQRVALAQALVHQPEILVLDEPTLGLDPRQVRHLRELIRELSKDTTMVISSHILPEIRQLCERVIILKEGRMAAVDSPRELSRRHRRGVNWQLEVAEPPGDWADRLLELDSVREVEQLSETEFQLLFSAGTPAEREQLFDFCVKRDVPILQLAPPELDLEELFIEIVENSDREEETNESE